MKTLKHFIAILIFCLLIGAAYAAAQTTAFTYQGRLTDTSMPATGTYDFQFALFDALTGGVQQPQPTPITQTISGVSVTNGIFTVQLDFTAAVFPGAERFLEIRVKRPADPTFTTLQPRQRLTSSPYSIRALNATNAETLGGIDSSSFVQTSSTAFIRNQSSPTQTANFSISGTGTANIFNAATHFSIGSDRVLSVGGIDNVFAGVNVGIGNTGSGNSFFGRSAGNTGNAGSDNSFFGASAGDRNTTGEFNSFFGRRAGDTNGGGNNNTIIGSNADVALLTLNYGSAFGANAVVSNSDTIVIGKIAGTYDTVVRPADTVRIPGNLIVTGTVSKGGGAFKIDHPLDPQNKYLSHSFVESPDMMNVYNGNITTDGQGEATVTLPDYFSALNRDFRYQLTVIGVFAQAIVGEEIKGNSFKIKTDKPGVKVSWQVTGIRQDKFAEDNRIPNEEDKPAEERGKCLYAPLCSGASINDPPRKP